MQLPPKHLFFQTGKKYAKKLKGSAKILGGYRERNQKFQQKGRMSFARRTLQFDAGRKVSAGW